MREWDESAEPDELRALLRAGFGDPPPPPLDDMVGRAIREGRRLRRRRRVAAAGSAAGVLVVAVAAAAGMISGRLPGLPVAAAPVVAPVAVPVAVAPPTGSPAVVSPRSVPTASARPVTVPPTRTVTVRSGTQRAEGLQKKATSAAMLHLLTTLLPPGRTSHYAVAADDDLHVQLYYDGGYGASMLRLAVGQSPATGRRPARGSVAEVTVRHQPGNCVQDTVVSAAWPDGTTVQLDVAGCLAYDGATNPPARPQLSETEATLIVSDARWGVTMDPGLVRLGAQQFPRPLPVFH